MLHCLSKESDGEQWDRILEVLNPHIAFDVGKDKCMTFLEAAKLAIRIDAAAQGHAFQSELHYTYTRPPFMDIENFGVSEARRFLSEEEKPFATENKCFFYEKVGCKPRKRAVQNLRFTSEEHFSSKIRPVCQT